MTTKPEGHQETDKLWDQMFEASDRLYDKLYGEVKCCPDCGSPLSDSGACADLGENNCMYMGGGESRNDE